MKNPLRHILFLGCTLVGLSLPGATCRATAIRAADTGNIIGYAVVYGGKAIIVQNAASVSAACNKLVSEAKLRPEQQES